MQPILHLRSIQSAVVVVYSAQRICSGKVGCPRFPAPLPGRITSSVAEFRGLRRLAPGYFPPTLRVGRADKSNVDRVRFVLPDMPSTHLSLHYHIIFSTKERRAF